MANQRLFINETAHMVRVGNSMSTKYCYNKKGQLTIFWKGEKVAERFGVKPGDAFIVSCDGYEPELHKLKLPHRNDDLLMWLLSFNKEERAYSAEEYTSLLDRQRSNYGWWNYRESGCSGDGYAFTLCNRSDCGGVYHIAAFVDGRKINRDFVKEVFRKFPRFIYWPQSFVEKILRDRFGFDSLDLAEIADCF